jgi:hypothetical protein
MKTTIENANNVAKEALEEVCAEMRANMVLWWFEFSK